MPRPATGARAVSPPGSLPLREPQGALKGDDMTESRPFAELAAEFLHDEFEQLRTRASGLGLGEYDGRFEDLSAEGWQARDAMAARWLARLDFVPDAGLAFDDRIDRDLIRSALRGRLILADF